MKDATMDTRDVALCYFQAWNEHDAAAIAELFGDNGRYIAPESPTGLDRVAIESYAKALFAGFSDLSLNVVRQDVASDGAVMTQWIMQGTHDGSLYGASATGRRVTVEGSDFLTIVDNKIRLVRRYFDRAALYEQLGLQVIVQPLSTPPISYGTSRYVSSGKTCTPGAFTLTVLDLRSTDEIQEANFYTLGTIKDMLDQPGFISSLIVQIGGRLFTITAWQHTKDSQAIRNSPAHAEAVQRYFCTDFGASGQVGTWIPYQLYGIRARCTGCGQMAPVPENGICRCGTAIPAHRWW